MDDIFKIGFAEQNDIDYLNDYGIGKVKVRDMLIQSAYDNSIPYEFFDVIEETFDTNRIHLG